MTFVALLLLLLFATTACTAESGAVYDPLAVAYHKLARVGYASLMMCSSVVIDLRSWFVRDAGVERPNEDPDSPAAQMRADVRAAEAAETAAQFAAASSPAEKQRLLERQVGAHLLKAIDNLNAEALRADCDMTDDEAAHAAIELNSKQPLPTKTRSTADEQ